VPSTQRFTRYTPLNTGRARILDEALNTDLIKESERCVSPQHGDRSKYCRYHRCHNHTTRECAVLRDKIEELIQAGQLQRYVAKGRQYGRCEERNPRERSPRWRDRSPRDMRKRKTSRDRSRERSPARREDTRKTIVNTISRGFNEGDASSSTRRRHLRAIKSVHVIN